jgi:hypothetical protein
MIFILWIATATQLFGGLVVLAEARSAIHQILGVLLIGFASLECGLAAILGELRKHHRAQSSQAAIRNVNTQSAQAVAAKTSPSASVYEQSIYRGIHYDKYTDHSVAAAIDGQRYGWPSESEFRKWVDSRD